MDRRSFLTSLLATPALLALLQSCGSEATTSPTNSTGPASGAEATSSKGRMRAVASEAAQASSVIDDFGVDMYRRLAARPSAGPNLVFSPASVAIALAMTRAGAKGATATEMDDVMHVVDAAALPRSMNALTSELDMRTKTVPIEGADATAVQLSIANSLWAQRDLTFEPAFLDLLAAEYGAGLQLVDYKADPDAARALINAWVNDATKERIPELLAPGVITTDARLTLVNAIYMKAAWEKTFSTSATGPAPFTTASGAVVQAPMMALHEHLAYAEGAGWQAVALPYVGGDLSMVVVLPDEDSSLDVAVEALGGLDDVLATQDVILQLPKFDTKTSLGLAEELAAMGMPSAFDRDVADFSGMTLEEKLFIGAVIHQANITVDEDGTEAAAATAVVMEAGAAPSDGGPIEMTVDRPFLFAVRDGSTGAILFLGHIGDPTLGGD